MNYYARLIELLSQLPPNSQETAVWLAQNLAASFGTPEQPLLTSQEEAFDALSANDLPHV